jgi:hypothetical protein
MAQPATPVPASTEVARHDQRLHELLQAITDKIAEIDGVTDVELVDHYHSPTFAVWGFAYDGQPQSLSWNPTL